MAYLAVGVAVLCALSVFFILCERDHSFLRQVTLYDAAAYITRANAPAPAAPVATEVPRTAAAHQASVQAVPGYIPFDVTRSKHFEPVGPISLGVWRTDPRHGTYDISILVEGQRFDKRHVGLDEALAIRIGNGAPMELVVNRVFRNEVSGYLSVPTPASTR